MRKNEIIVLSVAVALLVLGFIAFHLWGVLELSGKIDTAQVMEIIILFVLVLVTVIYAKRTSEIAKATKEQAKEMREQRYDAVRPVIDIQRGESNIAETLAADCGDTSHGLLCILHNIGLGPAIDVRSLVQPPWAPWGQSQRHDFGTFAIEGETTMNLSLEQEGNRTALVVYYKDVYGRAFESSREVQAGKKSEGWKVGPLKIVPVQENKP